MKIGNLSFIAILLTSNAWVASRSPGAMAAAMQLVAKHPNISATQGDNTSLTASINIRNSGSSTASLIVWSATFQVIADPSALGEVQIVAAAQPDDYILKDASPFGPMLVFGGPVPTSYATLSDAAILAEAGVSLAAQETASLVDLELTLSPAAVGKFYIVMGEFGEDPTTSSSWSDAITPETPRAFENGSEGSSIADRTLVEISVISLPEPTAIHIISLATIAWSGVSSGLCLPGISTLLKRPRPRL